MNSVRRGMAVMSSGALVVGAGAAVGVMAADMSGQWSDEAALKAAAQVVEDPSYGDPIPRAVIVTRIEERHVTPKPVVVHRKVYVRAPSGQGVTRAKAAPQRQTVRSAPKSQPSRKVVAPAPAPPKAPASAPKATSKTS